MSDNNHIRPKPPKLAFDVLKWFCDKRYLEEIEGDMEEYYLLYSTRNPKWKTRLFFWYHLITFLRPYALKKRKTQKNGIMISHHLKYAFRYQWKHKTNFLINLLSLSIGMAAFIFIFIYLKGELQYDKLYSDSDRIHRIVLDLVNEGERIPDATTPPALAYAMKQELPEIEKITRVFPSWGSKFLVGRDLENRIYEEKVYRVDPEFLEIFDFEVIQGNKDQLLADLKNIVLTRSSAEKYFGKEDPLGQELKIRSNAEQTYVVSGVIQDVPFHTHLDFEFLMPLHFTSTNIDENWGWYNYYTYVKLKENSSITGFQEKLPEFYIEANTIDRNDDNIIYSQPIEDIHLYSALKWELTPNNNINNIRIFVSVGGFILIISMINFLNLTIGNQARRLVEAGVRKSFGANYSNLVTQSIIETCFVAFISFLIACILAQIFLITQADLFGREILIYGPENLGFILFLGLTILLLGVSFGIYPALKFSKQQTVQSIIRKKKSGFFDLKKILLLVQFGISTMMIVCTLIVYQQLRLYQNRDVGYSTDQVLIVENARAIENQDLMINQLQQLPGVKVAGFSDGVLGKLNWTFAIGYPDPFLMNYSVVTPSYFEIMDIEFVKGENFDKNNESHRTGYNFIVNEKAIENFGISMEQVGQSFPVTSQNDSLIYGRIIGVVNDFHFTNFKTEIEPYAFIYRDNPKEYLTIKLKASDLAGTIESVENVWRDISGGLPFDNYFMDAAFAQLYETEQRLSRVMLYLTVLSIFISCIGMFAVANIVIRDRIKEIAIRKIHGSTIPQLIQRFSSSFVATILVANAIGLPFAYMAMRSWLEDYAYRIEPGFSLFFITLLSTTAISAILVSWRIYYVSNRNLLGRLKEE